MDFRFEDDTLDLRDGARAFLEGENGAERLRSLADGADPLALWPKLSEMGLIGAVADEARGGLGLSIADGLLLAEEAGRSGLPEPLSDIGLVLLPALAELGGEAEGHIAQLVTGDARGIVVHPLNPFTNHAAGADFALVFDVASVSLAKTLQADPRSTIDPGRQLSAVTTNESASLLTGKKAEALSAKTAARGAAAAAAELCGLADKMIELATEYSKSREQFGKPIGTFQAVKHLMANAQVKLEFARPVVYRAGGAIDGDPDVRDLAVSHAKVAAGDAAMLAAENAIQVFGGMGYTFEVDLHFYMKRAWALIGIWGDRNYHMQRIDTAILGGARAVGPGETFA